jgi:hypothetical protein
MMQEHATKRHAEIDRRYRRDRAKRQRPRPDVPLAAIRIAELRRLYRSRWGPTLPDDDAGRDDALVMAHHLARRHGDAQHHIEMYLQVNAPWMDKIEAESLVATVLVNPIRFRADTLAERMNLTWKERERLGIKTIGAVDVPKAERERRRHQRKRSRDRTRREQRRRAKGAEPRSRYLAKALAQTRPWEALGISRRSWYRRRGTGA